LHVAGSLVDHAITAEVDDGVAVPPEITGAVVSTGAVAVRLTTDVAYFVVSVELVARTVTVCAVVIDAGAV
jgi:hypothetical protein